MSERKKRALWPILTAALIGMPILFVLSSGSAVKLSPKLSESGAHNGAWFDLLYGPLFTVLRYSPDWVRSALLNYWSFCGADMTALR